MEILSSDDLSSRLKLNVNAASVGPLLLSDSFITIMDVSPGLILLKLYGVAGCNNIYEIEKARKKSRQTHLFMSTIGRENICIRIYI